MKTASANNLNRKRRWMITYDISDDRLRRMIHTILKDHGHCVQYSVFECELSKKQQLTLRAQLTDFMDVDDSIRWYPLCRWCESRIHWTGKGQAPQFDNFHVI